MTQVRSPAAEARDSTTFTPLDRRNATSHALRGTSLIRAALHQAVSSHVSLTGDVLDMGGGPKASYRPILGPSAQAITSIDGGDRMEADLSVDLETAPVPFDAGSFDTILAFNLLEHIYHHAQLLGEAHRVLRPGGVLYVWVPFLIGYHPDPEDHFRYTHESLFRLLTEAGFDRVSIHGYGGRFAASANIAIAAIPPKSLRTAVVLAAFAADRAYYRFARRGSVADVPLGYLAVATRHSAI